MKNQERIIVTGGLGFIGSNLINILKDKYFIINIDKVSYASNFKNIDPHIRNYMFYKQDINNKNFIKNILKKYNPSIIYNLAAETHVDRSIDGPKTFITSNILGVFNLLESIRDYKKKIKLIHISTDEVYGDIKKNHKSKEDDQYNPSSPYSASKASGDLLIKSYDEVYGDIKKNHKSKEDDQYNPSSPYSASKASGDLLIKSYIRTYKIPAIITNCCNNFGPNQYPEKLIPTIIYNILNQKTIPIYGKGKNVREWIYVKDHCNALIKIAQKGVIGENYNIGSGTVLNNIQITKRIISVIKKINHNQNIKSKIHFVKDRPGHDLRYCLDSSKIKDKLKWKCETSFDQRINETIVWYINKFRNNYFKNEDFKCRIGLTK